MVNVTSLVQLMISEVVLGFSIGSVWIKFCRIKRVSAPFRSLTTMATSRASSGLDASVVKTAMIVLLGLCSLQNVDSTSSGPRNPSFVLYAVRNGADTANPSEVQIFPATGLKNPVVRVSDLALVESANINSREVGRLRLQTVTNFGSPITPAMPPRIYITGVLDLIAMKDSENGTISSGGIQTALTVGAIDEFPILGGSGEYRFASGYIKFTLLSPVDALGTTIFGKIEFYLCKPSSCHI
ncbi:hypothetical protein AXG93_1390s1000 [Marchantia polymorpha subsp. ruderalis]|uniref:Dirigent protein n=3 Tax=Marchantia polymorpha TaxID=3197 RepID=A0A176W7S9_MARPO|nr:hypothetical protein AXG93_1390s1000 [Marchantia polymorpha subsp. ruderalis]